MERLQKYMARCGVASRRKAELMITNGQVMVNGREIRELGYKINPDTDTVLVNGKKITPEEEKVYILLNKPKGYVTTASDPQGRPTVLDLINKSPALYGTRLRLFPVGRLDFNTTGLLLLTNDGELAYALTHPSHQVNKTYEALVKGVPVEEGLNTLRRGILLEDGLTAPAEVDILGSKAGNAILRLVIHEGRKRQVRRMCQSIGHPIITLKRVALGPIDLGLLKPGDYRNLTPEELSILKNTESNILKKGEANAPHKKR